MKVETEGGKVMLAHGGGGSAMRALIEDMFVKAFSNQALNALGDSAVLPVSGQRLAFTTDSYVIKPIFFKGGDIGRLAVCGTVNDLAVSGARPVFLALSFIIEEGFPLENLQRVVNSTRLAAEEADVKIVTGDTKVVERGAADGLFINTSGIGWVNKDLVLSPERIEIGDAVILSGSLAEHGISILSQRGEYEFEANIESDVAPLYGLVESILAVSSGVRFMRDLTRGGLAAALNEVAVSAARAIEIDEKALPIKNEVRAACEMLGLDPLQVANEGKLVAICSEKDSQKVLHEMRLNELGKGSVQIGHVVKYRRHIVYGRTSIGGSRIIEMPTGRLLPRIC